jgi:hypothetical protein
MNDGGLNQVARAIEFVEISEILETMPGPPGKDMTIYVPVRRLSMFEAGDDIVHRVLQAIVFGLLEIGRRSFKPFSKIRVPKNTGSPIPIANDRSATVHFLIKFEGIDMPLSAHFFELME